MRRVVIVEDEKLVLLGIVSLFEGNDRYTITGSYTNPIKALDVMTASPPDILITDIKMPQMDGLSFIQKVKQIDPGIRIIVLSCYDDFSTVSRAFKLGIDDYLLKHEIEGDNLFRSLDALSVSNEHLPGPRYTGSADIRAILQQISEQEFSSSLGIIALFVFKKTYKDTFEPNKAVVNIVWCQQLIQNLMDSLHLGKAYAYKNTEIVCVMKGDEAFSAVRGQFFQEIKKQLLTYINRPVVILKSPPTRSAEVLQTWDSLISMLGCVYYHNGERIITEDSQHCQVSSAHIQLPDPLSFFSPGNSNAWEHAMRTYREEVLDKRPDPSTLCMDLLVYWHEIEQLLENIFGEEVFPYSDSAAVYETIRTFDDASMLIQWFVMYTKQIQKKALSLHGHKRIVIRIKIFLYNHYAEHISLATLSEHFHLNENYLCELFKKDTGIGYLEYLNTIRVDQAKTRMISSDDTAEIICQEVGFSNASHFSRVFKKITGMTMTEFREQHLLSE